MSDKPPRITNGDVFELVGRVEKRLTELEAQFSGIQNIIRVVAREEAREAQRDSAQTLERLAERVEGSTDNMLSVLNDITRDQRDLSRRVDSLEIKHDKLEGMLQQQHILTANVNGSLTIIADMTKSRDETLREHGNDIDALQAGIAKLFDAIAHNTAVQRDFETRTGYFISKVMGYNPAHPDGTTRTVPNMMTQVEDLMQDSASTHATVTQLSDTVQKLSVQIGQKSPTRLAAESAFPRPVRRFAWRIATNPNTYRFLAALLSLVGLSGLSQLLNQLAGM